jgi:hypothetical protein
VHFDARGNLLIWDGGRQKMVAVDREGELIVDKRFPELPARFPQYLGQAEDGRFVFLDRTFFIPRPSDPPGLVQQWSHIVALDTARRISTIVDSVVFGEAFAAGQGFGRVTLVPPNSARSEVVVAGGKIWTGFSRDSMLVVHDLRGNRVDSLAHHLAAHPVSQAAWEEAWAKRVERADGDFRQRIAAVKGDVPRFETYPRFIRLLATPGGTVAAYAPVDESRKVWGLPCVVVATGERCPEVRTQEGEVVLAISSGRAAVAVEQEDGTWRVVIRRMRN